MKKGFTLIELIFTIVILAITTMAIPRIVAQTAESNLFAVKQELVLSAKTLLARIGKAPWDTNYITSENSCTANPNRCVIPVKIHTILNGEGGVGATTCSDTSSPRCTLARPGILTSDSLHREISIAPPAGKANFGSKKTKEAGATSNGPTAYNDIDDYDGYQTTMRPPVIAIDGQTTGDFLLTTQIDVVVDYVSDVLTAGNYAGSQSITGVLSSAPANRTPTNLKMITITASDVNDPGRSITLRTYSANIGTATQNILTR